MAAMVCEPARPSPTAAPMAPPPSASPPPTRAPAIRTAPSIVLAAMFPLLCRDRVRRDRVRNVRWSPGCSVRVPAHAHAEVHDGQEGEDEGLDRADEQLVERLPHEQADPRRVGRDQRHDHHDHQHAREDVAEEPEREGDRLGDLLDDVDRGQCGVGLGVVLEVPLPATRLHRVVVHQEDDGEGQSQGKVHVARRRGQEPRVAAGDEGEPVADQDEEGDRDPQADEGEALGADGGRGQVGDLLDERLPEELKLPGHSGGDLGPHAQAETQDDGRRDERGPHHVAVDSEARYVPHTAVGADRDVAAGEHEAVAAHRTADWTAHWIPCEMMTRPTLTTKSNWKMTRPATAPIPSAPFKSNSPMQITVMMPRRVTLLSPMARRSTLLVVSPSVLSLATPASRKRRLSTAMVRPMARPSAAHGTEGSSAITIATAPTMRAETMVRRRTLDSALPPRSESPSSMFTAAPLQVGADLL